MSDYINKTPPFFYILDLRDKSEWAVTEIDDSKNQNRLGWLNCECVNPGTNDKNYIGGPMGVDCGYVFMSGNWDYSKHPFTTPFPGSTSDR